MQPQDISRTVSVSSPAVSPDGARIAYVVSRVDAGANAYRSAVWIAAADGRFAPFQLTGGEHREGQPAWSPDGSRIAFTSARGEADAEHSLCVIGVDRGGEVVTIARRNEAISSPRWSPDGVRIAFLSRVQAERYEPKEEAERPPRKIDRLFPRLNGEGWTVDRPVQLFVVAADGSADPEQLTRGSSDIAEGPAWAPDSRFLAVVAAWHENADLGIENDIYLVDSAAPQAEPRKLTATNTSFGPISIAPDGRLIAAIEIPTGIGYRHGRLTMVHPGDGSVQVVSAGLDRTALPYPGVRPPVWTAEGVLFSIEDHGSVHLYRAAPDGGLSRLSEGELVVAGFDAAGGTTAMVLTDPVRPTELCVLTPGGPRQLTGHQASFLHHCPPLGRRPLQVTSGDGTPLDAWVVYPPNVTAGQRIPALITVHGGPHTQYSSSWFDEVQLYASAGYAVVYGNIHGSTNHTEAFARAIISPKSPVDPGTGWGGVDFADVMTIVDAAIAQCPEIDPDRFGIIGGSYGGYMTSWAIGHTNRFKAAVSERAVNNLLSEEWSADCAGYFGFEIGVRAVDDPAEFLRMSPQTYAKSIETPVMILHSEDDWRCPTEQADSLFVALRLLGKPVEYYRFPAETHELSRSGSPKHRQQRVELILDWFSRML